MAVDDDEIKINMTDSEVKADDVFDVKLCGEEKFDPDTNESLGYSGKTVGRVVIQSADARMATGEADDRVKISKGSVWNGMLRKSILMRICICYTVYKSPNL